jgi:hypothetical protein
MTTLSDGLSNVQALTAKINALKKNDGTAAADTSQKTTTDPNEALLTIQQDFNSMLNTLISSPDDEKDEEKNDSLSSFLNDYRTTATDLSLQQKSGQVSETAPE